MPYQLHERQAGRLDATLSLVDKGLDRMERLLAERGRSGIVREVENSLGEGERAQLLEAVRDFRAALEQFAEKFSLPQRAADIRQLLNAELSSAWVMLENCRPRRMKGYGIQFDPAARAALEQGVEQLLATIQQMRAVIQ